MQRNISKRRSMYREVLNTAVDEALNQIFGSTAADIIYSYLESNHSIQKDEIATKLESFNHAMQRYLNSGATVLEAEILQRFYSDLGMVQPVELESDYEFVERIRTLIPR